MLKNYKLVKTSELEAMRQQIDDLNSALVEATDLLDQASKVISNQKECVERQQAMIEKQHKRIMDLLFGVNINTDIDFPNTMKGGFQDQ